MKAGSAYAVEAGRSTTENVEPSKEPHTGDLLRTVIILQIISLYHLCESLGSSVFSIMFPCNPGRRTSFGDFTTMEEKLRLYDVRYAPFYLCSKHKLMIYRFCQLPPKSDAWDTINLPRTQLPPLPTWRVDETCIAEEILITSPLDLQDTPCEVTKANRKDWTAAERAKADLAEIVKDIETLIKRVSV